MAFNRTKEPKKPFHEVFAEEVIKQLEEGTVPWMKPWSDGAPYNPVTGTHYRGSNNMWLSMRGRRDPRWMTYKQATENGYQVRRGEKGTTILAVVPVEERIKKDKDGNIIRDSNGKPVKEENTSDRVKILHYTVFNGEQIDNLPELPKREENTFAINERAENILLKSKAVIHHQVSSRAYYSPSRDEIILPLHEQFKNENSHYATALHELGHWTGHKSRLNREFNADPFGSENYAKEELRAEMSSMMLGREIGLQNDQELQNQHAAYISSWIKVLKENPMEIVFAARDAEKIKDYILGLEAERELTQDRENISLETSAVTQEQLVEAILKEKSERESSILEIENMFGQWHLREEKAGNHPALLSVRKSILTAATEKELQEKIIGIHRSELKETAIDRYNQRHNLTGDNMVQLEEDGEISISDGNLDNIAHEIDENLSEIVSERWGEFSPSIRSALIGHLPNKENTISSNEKIFSIYDASADPDNFDEIFISGELAENSQKALALLSESEFMLGKAQEWKMEEISSNPQKQVLTKPAELKEWIIEKCGQNEDTTALVNIVFNRIFENEINKANNQEKPKIIEAKAQKVSTQKRAEREYLNCPRKEKDEAKALGAWWDKEASKWYVSPKATPSQREELLKRWPEAKDVSASPTASVEDIEADFLKSLIAADFAPEQDNQKHPIIDGKKHRCPVVGDKGSEKSGFYIGFMNEGNGCPAGVIENNKTKWKDKWIFKGNLPTKSDMVKIRQKAAEKKALIEKEISQKQEEKSITLTEEFKNLSAIQYPTHYMKAKGIELPYAHGMKVGKYGETVIPAYDVNGKQWTSQYIQKDGKKRFASEARKEGCFYPIGGIDVLDALKQKKQNLSSVIIVCEGVATASSVQEAFKNNAVIAAFDSGNLLKVAKELKENYPSYDILIAGDNDQAVLKTHNKNPGVEKALEAAKAVSGVAVIADFPDFPQWPSNVPMVTAEAWRNQDISEEQRQAIFEEKKLTDFNDLATKSLNGKEHLKSLISKGIEEIKNQEQGLSAQEEHDRNVSNFLVKGRSKKEEQNEGALER